MSNLELIQTLRTAAASQPINAELFNQAADAIEELDRDLETEIENRDKYHEWADLVSDEIARFMHANIGEHTSANNPWLNAFECIPDSDINKIKADAVREWANQANPQNESEDRVIRDAEIYADKLERGEL